MLLELPSFAIWAAEFGSKSSIRVVMVMMARLHGVLRLYWNSRLLRLTLRLRLMISVSWWALG
jgi:hypothetical protein